MEDPKSIWPIYYPAPVVRSDVLEKNPKKDPKKYDEDDDIPHMRKVVSYCKRHLAQESTAKQNPDSKSCKSLKNWGHNPQKS